MDSVFIQQEAIGVFGKPSEVSAVTLIPEKILDCSRELRRAIAGDREVLIHLLTKPAQGISGDDPGSRVVRLIGAATVPGRAEINKCAAAGHDGLSRRIMVAGLIVFSVAFWYNVRRAVFNGEVCQRKHHACLPFNARNSDGIDDVILVEHLCFFPRHDLNGGAAANLIVAAMGQQQGVHEFECMRLLNKGRSMH